MGSAWGVHLERATEKCKLKKREWGWESGLWLLLVRGVVCQRITLGLILHNIPHRELAKHFVVVAHCCDVMH
jgi:hypothetical protein